MVRFFLNQALCWIVGYWSATNLHLWWPYDTVVQCTPLGILATSQINKKLVTLHLVLVFGQKKNFKFGASFIPAALAIYDQGWDRLKCDWNKNVETNTKFEIWSIFQIMFGVHFLEISKIDIFWNLATFKLFNGEELVKIE